MLKIKNQVFPEYNTFSYLAPVLPTVVENLVLLGPPTLSVPQAPVLLYRRPQNPRTMLLTDHQRPALPLLRLLASPRSSRLGLHLLICLAQAQNSFPKPSTPTQTELVSPFDTMYLFTSISAYHTLIQLIDNMSVSLSKLLAP